MRAQGGGMFKITFLAALLLFWITSIGNAADFYLSFEKCTTTVGYLVLSDQSLKSSEGTGFFMGCTRISNTIRCETEFKDGSKGHKGNLAEYKVDLDSPPLLIFTDGKMADYFVIDLTQHAVTIITRSGQDVCGRKGLPGHVHDRKRIEGAGKTEEVTVNGRASLAPYVEPFRENLRQIKNTRSDSQQIPPPPSIIMMK